MLEIIRTNRFEKDYRKAHKQGKNLKKLHHVVELLAREEVLPPKYRDHALTGNWAGFRECRIEPDWLLIYYIDNEVVALVLSRLGSHADFF